jgi:glyoxylase-like metal-dependent hydrolase (beta-lactamase superfamily II)
MKVHHLNCATMCPIGGRLVSGAGALTDSARMVCHCLLIETGSGLVLVESGLGLRDVERPSETVGREFVLLTRPKLDPAETAVRRVETLGFQRSDVRHVVLTHLDLDHAGGIADFPDATVHLLADERDAALNPRTRLERRRYIAAHWEHGPKWSVYRPSDEPWFGFECVRDLPGLPPEILLIPLIGHSRGHSGVAVDTGKGWLLHAGDAYFNRGEMDPDRRRCPPALDLFQRIVEIDGRMRMRNQNRLRLLSRENSSEVRVFSAHDPIELERMQERAGAVEPAHA